MSSFLSSLDKKTLIQYKLGFPDFNFIDDSSCTALSNACKCGNLDIVIRLYESNKSSINYLDIHNNNSLIYACKFNHTDIAIWIIKFTEININHLNKDNFSAFTFSCLNNNILISKTLLEYNSIVYNILTIENKYPIDYISSSSMSNIKELIQNFNDINNIKHFNMDDFIFNSHKFKNYQNIFHKDSSCSYFLKTNSKSHQLILKELQLLKLILPINKNISLNLIGFYLNSTINLVFEQFDYYLFSIFDIYSKIPSHEQNKYYIRLFSTLLKNLHKLHSLGIIHNSISSSSIVIDSSCNVKFINFEYSDFFNIGSNKKLLYPSHSSYSSYPDNITNIIQFSLWDGRILQYEISRKSYSSDLFSLGIVFLESILPYKNTNYQFFDSDFYYLKPEDSLYYPISNTDLNKINSISPYFLSLLTSMFSINSSTRLSSKDLLSHPFFTSSPFVKDSVKLDSITSPSHIPSIYINNKISVNYFRYSLSDFQKNSFEFPFTHSIHHFYSKNIFKISMSTDLLFYENLFNNSDCLNTFFNSTQIFNYTDNYVFNIYFFQFIFENKVSSSFTSDLTFSTIFNKIFLSNYSNLSIIPVTFYIQFIILQLQILNIDTNIINYIEINLYSFLFYWIIFNKSLTFSIWDIIQSIFIRICIIKILDINISSFITLSVNSDSFIKINNFFNNNLPFTDTSLNIYNCIKYFYDLEPLVLTSSYLKNTNLTFEFLISLRKNQFKKERLEKERLHQERLLKERLEKERLEQERLEQERLEKERLEKERLEKERLEKERLEKERLEQERLEQERLELERLEKERVEKERLEKEKLDKERLDKERVDQEKLDDEKKIVPLNLIESENKKLIEKLLEKEKMTKLITPKDKKKISKKK